MDDLNFLLCSHCFLLYMWVFFTFVVLFWNGSIFLCTGASWGPWTAFSQVLSRLPWWVSVVYWRVSIAFASAFDLLLCNVARWILFPISKVSLCGYRFGWVYFRLCSMFWKVYCGSVLGRSRSRGHGVRDIKRFLFTVNLHNSPMGK